MGVAWKWGVMGSAHERVVTGILGGRVVVVAGWMGSAHERAVTGTWGRRREWHW